MALDFGVLVLLFLYALFGLTRGLMSQIIGLVGITAAWVLAPMGAPLVRKLLFSSGTETWAHVEVASMLVAAVIVLVVVQLLFRLIPDLLRRWSDALRGVDTALGTVLGLVRGAITGYLLLCAMIYAESPMVRSIPEMRKQMQTSRVVAEVRKNNLLTTLQFSDLDLLRRGLAAAGSASADPDDAAIAKKLSGVEAFRTAAKNSELRQLARDGRSSELLDHPMVHKLMADERVRSILGAPSGPAPARAPETVRDVGRTDRVPAAPKRKKSKRAPASKKLPAEEIDPGIDE